MYFSRLRAMGDNLINELHLRFKWDVESHITRTDMITSIVHIFHKGIPIKLALGRRSTIRNQGDAFYLHKDSLPLSPGTLNYQTTSISVS